MKNIDIKSLIIGTLLSSTIFLGVAAVGQKTNGELPNDIPSLKALAEKGDARAQTKLGSMYFMGNGVQEDHNEGAKWLRKAAAQGDEEAKGWMQSRLWQIRIGNIKPDHNDKKAPSKLIPSGSPDASGPTKEGNTTHTPHTGTLQWDNNQEWHYKFLNVFDAPADNRDQINALRKKLAIAEDAGGFMARDIPELKAQIAQLTAGAPNLTGYQPFAASGKYIWYRKRTK